MSAVLHVPLAGGPLGRADPARTRVGAGVVVRPATVYLLTLCRSANVDAEATEAAEVMARYCRGDAAAFHLLYQRLAPRLLAYLMGPVRDKAAAEDILQLTFLKIHEARATYIIGANPIPWIYTVAHRTYLPPEDPWPVPPMPPVLVPGLPPPPPHPSTRQTTNNRFAHVFVIFRRLRRVWPQIYVWSTNLGHIWPLLEGCPCEAEITGQIFVDFPVLKSA